MSEKVRFVNPFFLILQLASPRRNAYAFRHMADPKVLHGLCLDETGAPKPKNECRAVIINHLILEEMMDIDEAEDLADKTLRETGFWSEPEQI
jgi:hypothetical protein